MWGLMGCGLCACVLPSELQERGEGLRRSGLEGGGSLAVCIVVSGGQAEDRNRQGRCMVLLCPLWPCDATWRQRTWSPLVQLMNWSRTGDKSSPEPMMTCCSLDPGTNFDELYNDTNTFIQEDVFENIICEMDPILFRLQCIKTPYRHIASSTPYITTEGKAVFKKGYGGARMQSVATFWWKVWPSEGKLIHFVRNGAHIHSLVPLESSTVLHHNWCCEHCIAITWLHGTGWVWKSGQ